MTKRQATPVLLPFSLLISTFVFVVLLIFLYMIPLLLSLFLGLEALLSCFEPLLFCKYEKPEYHTMNDIQIDESEHT
jgi:hypothetical protein